MKVDDEEISNKEYWKRRIIIARRQKQPSSFGFYSPAKDDAEGDGSIRRKKVYKVSELKLHALIKHLTSPFFLYLHFEGIR